MTPEEEVINALRRLCPTGATVSLGELRQACKMSAKLLSPTLRALRYAGKIEWDRIALAPGMQLAEVCASPAPAEKPLDVAEAVKAEARAAAEARASARSISSVLRASTITAETARRSASIGAELQRLAVETPQDAASILNRRWGTVWRRLCAHARAADQRPVPHMVALLEQALMEGREHP